MTKVFISYGRGDDEAFVARLHERLTAAEFNVWFDRLSMPSRALSFLQEIRDAIHSSDRLVIVLGPRAANSDYVRAEWQYALTDEKIVAPLLRLGSFDLIPTELKDFHCEDCRLAKDESAIFSRIIEILRERVAVAGQICGDVPSLPPCFQPRPQDMTNLAGLVMEDLRNAIVLTPPERITLRYGMGGIGKSAMAAALARSIGTRRAFPDGICWAGIRQDTTALEALRQISVLLSHEAAQN